jgi:hypothetical protein
MFLASAEVRGQGSEVRGQRAGLAGFERAEWVHVTWTDEILLAIVILDWDCLEIGQVETEPLHIRIAEIGPL